MSDTFEMRIRLDGASMNEFGEAVGKLGIEFPALILADAQTLSTFCAADPIDLPAIQELAARMANNAELATKIGNAVATVIGMCQPERIDGGPVQ